MMNGFLVSEPNLTTSFFAADYVFNSFHAVDHVNGQIFVITCKLMKEDVIIEGVNKFMVRRASIYVCGYHLSVVWGTNTYSTNKLYGIDESNVFHEKPNTVEIMVDKSDDVLSYVTPAEFITLWKQLTKEEPNNSVESLTL